MTTQTNKSPTADAGDLVITRVFDAPRDLVWRAHTEADRLVQWWGPKGFSMKVAKLDLRPGGLFHYGMTSPAGQEMWGKFVYREIAAQDRLVYVVSFSDAQAGVTRHPMAETWPLETLNTLTFEERDGKTTLTLRGRPINATDAERQTFAGAFDGMRQGFKGTLDQLDAYLAAARAAEGDVADRQIVMSRTFDAPRELVFAAWTKAEHLGQWWGPNGFTTTTDEMAFQPGGSWRYMMHGPDGTDYPNLIVYDQITPPGRITYGHGDGAPDAAPMFRVTVDFEDRGGKTLLTMRIVFPDKASCDKTKAFGAIEGGQQTLGRLAAFLAKR